MPTGSFNIDTVCSQLNAELESEFGKGNWLLSHDNMQLYLNRELLKEKKASRPQILDACRKFLIQYPAIADVVDLENLTSSSVQPSVKTLLANGYNVKRSGDFQILYNAGWFEEYGLGATHGTQYNYDTHIPLLWMGWHVKHGTDHADIHMTDIAPTLAAMLHIQEPSGSVGKVIAPVAGK